MDGIKAQTGLHPLTATSPKPHPTAPEETHGEKVETDALELDQRERRRPRIVFQVVSDQVEEVGGQLVQKEVFEEREELDGETLRSTFHTLTTQLESGSGPASAAHSGLDPARIRNLLAD